MAGRAGTRRLKQRVRPTSSLVRAALFNRLGPRVRAAEVLDLFAGTGGLGIEALHRGAARVVFVERDANLVATIRTALARAGFTRQAEVWRRDALTTVRELGRTRRRFDVIVLDPPYGEGWIPRTLRVILGAGILAEDGVVIAEGHWRDRPSGEPGLVCTREARYGETMLWYFARGEGGSEG